MNDISLTEYFSRAKRRDTPTTKKMAHTIHIITIYANMMLCDKLMIQTKILWIRHQNRGNVCINVDRRKEKAFINWRKGGRGGGGIIVLKFNNKNKHNSSTHKFMKNRNWIKHITWSSSSSAYKSAMVRGQVKSVTFWHWLCVAS